MRRLLLAAPAIVALLVLSPALAGGFCWDDRQLIVDNPETLSSASIQRVFGTDFWDLPQSSEAAGYWRPLISISFLLDKALFGLAPFGWHLESWAIHAVIAVGLGLYLRDRGQGPGIAAAGATLWAIHPAILEPSCWVSGRADLLAAGLVLAGLHADRRGMIPLAVGCFAAALTAKEAAVGGILAALVLVWFRTSVKEGAMNRAPTSRDHGPGPDPAANPANGAQQTREASSSNPQWRPDSSGHATAPYAMLAWFNQGKWYLALLAAYAAFRILATPRPVNPAGLAWELRLFAVPHLLGVLAVPWLGRIEYGTDLPVILLIPGALLGAVLTVMALRRPSPLALAGFAAMIPGILAILSRGATADRLLYLPGMFLIPAALEAIWPHRHLRVAVPAILGAFAIISFERASWWKNDVSLFTAAAAQGAPSPRSRLNLGIAVHQHGDLQLAESMLRPIAPELREGAYEVGLIWTEAGCFARAEQYYRRALDIDPYQRSAAMNLVTLLSMSGRPIDAKKVADTARGFTQDPDLDRALGASPTTPHVDPPLCAQDATARAALGDPVHLGDRAHEALVRRDFRMADVLLAGALQRDPSQRRARLDRAQSAALQGDFASARAETDTLRLEFPGDAATKGLDDWLRNQGH